MKGSEGRRIAAGHRRGPVYVFGIHHITRVEEWPVMPVDVVSFWLKPSGFFNQNPSLDAAPPG